MDFSTPAAWWVAAGVLVALELLTGTFYLLMLALGLAAAALAAHLSASLTTQWVVAALAGLMATVGWHWRRRRHPVAKPAASNADVNLDIGSPVWVSAWEADGSARVQHRGTQWTAWPAPGSAAVPGAHRISAVRGNGLELSPVQGLGEAEPPVPPPG